MIAHPSETHTRQIIGRNLRQLRESRGLTQEGLGALLGVTFQQVQKYEKGLTALSAARLFTLSRVLHVPCAWFFEGAEEPESALLQSPPLNPTIECRALKLQQHPDPRQRQKILKIIDILLD